MLRGVSFCCCLSLIFVRRQYSLGAKDLVLKQRLVKSASFIQFMTEGCLILDDGGPSNPSLSFSILVQMAVCFEPMNSIVVLDDDDDEEERPQTSSSSSQPSTNPITPPRAQIPAPTHITQSPFASAKKESHVLQAENHRLFTEVNRHNCWVDSNRS